MGAYNKAVRTEGGATVANLTGMSMEIIQSNHHSPTGNIVERLNKIAIV